MFFFCFNPQGSAPAHRIDPAGIIKRLMPYAPPDKSGYLADAENSLLVQCLHWNTARSRLEPVPFHHGPSDTTAASWARLDNRDELAKKLDIDSAELARCCDTELILQSYLKWGEACVDHLIGDFVFVIHDRRNSRVFCGRDQMGVRPLYYFSSDNLFVCATSLAAFRHLKGVTLEIDSQWVAEYLVQLSMSFDRTPYSGIKKLPPAHSLTVTAERTELRQYFQLSAEPELKLKDSREYVIAYREQLEEAIRCRLDSDYPIGSELSGGIDSSTITAFAARFLEQPNKQLHTFGFAFAELEPRYIMAVAQACRLHNNHIVAAREAESEKVRKRSLALLGYPVEHGTATLHEPFYHLAEQIGIRTLLSGFGGDEFGTTIHGYLVPMGMAVQGRYRELFNTLPGNPLYRVLRLLKLEWRRRKTNDFKEYGQIADNGFVDAYKSRWPHRVVRDELAVRYGLEERYFEDARFDTGYTDLKKFTLEKRWQPFMPTRMENCSLMAAGRRIDYRWPLLDLRLVRLFLSIPSQENIYRGMGRYLHRRAIDGVVPQLVAWKQGKDMGMVTGQREDSWRPLLDLDVSELHPALEEYIDTELLRRQVKQLPSLGNGPGDNRRFQVTRNISSAMKLSAWFKHLETGEGLS